MAAQPVGQSARWLATLQEYGGTIVHRPGTQHSNAYALSRKPCTRPNLCFYCRPENTQCNAVEKTQSATVPEAVDQPVDIWNRNALEEAQRTDPEIRPVYEALQKTPDKPEKRDTGLWSRESKILLHSWPRLKIRDGVLYRQFVELDGLRDIWQLVVPAKYRQQAFTRAHSGMTGGHLGLAKTQDQIQRRMYWLTWKSDSEFFIRRCAPCAQYHRGKAPKQAHLNPFPAGNPCELLSLDITGPHPKSRNGNEYILTITDSFTKWAEALPIRRHTADVVSTKLVEVNFSRFGAPLRILSVNVPEFESALLAELCRSYGIAQIRTSAYQPSTNGGIERFHRILNSMLAKVVEVSHKDWDKRVPEVMAAYRATKHESTGFTPNFLVLGREVSAPLDLMLPVSDEPDGIGTIPDEFVDEMLQRRRQAFELARNQLGREADRRKKEYDLTVRERSFKRGMWVWYFYPRRYVNKSPKWQRHYTGPNLIVKEMPPCNFVLQQTARSKSFVTHVDKLKEIFGDPPVASWLPDEVNHLPVDGEVVPEVALPAQQLEGETAPARRDTPARQRSSQPVQESDDDGPCRQTPPVRQLRPRDQRRGPVRYRQQSSGSACSRADWLPVDAV